MSGTSLTLLTSGSLRRQAAQAAGDALYAVQTTAAGTGAPLPLTPGQWRAVQALATHVARSTDEQTLGALWPAPPCTDPTPPTDPAAHALATALHAAVGTLLCAAEVLTAEGLVATAILRMTWRRHQACAAALAEYTALRQQVAWVAAHETEVSHV